MGSAYDDLDRPPLDAAVLRRALVTPESLWDELVVVGETASTNTDLADQARAGAPGGRVLVAEHQVQGRGRLERSWTAPARSALTLSLLLRPEGLPPARWSWLPLLTGVAVCEAVRRRGDLPASLKWPNDVLVDDRKLGGVLLERVEGGEAPAAAVVGIGLNVSMRADERPVDSATSLALEGASTTDRTVVLREVLRVFEQLYRAWLAGRGDASSGLASSYSTRCDTLGRRVRIAMPSGQTLHGTATRIDTDGHLVVDTGSAERVVSAGDVIHLREGM